MTFEEFTNLVAAMRDCQKRYFATRSVAALHESKDYERRVDASIRAIRNPPSPSLFDHEKGDQ